MSAKTNDLKLGLFTLVGLGLLITGILAFGTWSAVEKKTLFETYVPGDVSGLSVGSAVEFRGVHVGKVDPHWLFLERISARPAGLGRGGFRDER